MNRVPLNIDNSGSSGSSHRVEGLHTHSQIQVFNSETSVRSETSLCKLASSPRSMWRVHGYAASDVLLCHFKRSICNSSITAGISLLFPLLEDRCSLFTPVYRRITEVNTR